MTMALWARGILRDDYGVDCRTFKTRTSAEQGWTRKERLPLVAELTWMCGLSTTPRP